MSQFNPFLDLEASGFLGTSPGSISDLRSLLLGLGLDASSLSSLLSRPLSLIPQDRSSVGLRDRRGPDRSITFGPLSDEQVFRQLKQGQFGGFDPLRGREVLIDKLKELTGLSFLGNPRHVTRGGSLQFIKDALFRAARGGRKDLLRFTKQTLPGTGQRLPRNFDRLPPALRRRLLENLPPRQDNPAFAQLKQLTDLLDQLGGIQPRGFTEFQPVGAFA